MKTTTRGFTLIELVITVAILALIAAIAIPSYRQYVLRSHRVEATTALMAIAAAQEKFYLQNDTYTTNLTDAPPAGLGIADYDAGTAGVQTENGWYTISIDNGANDETYTARAAARGDQAVDTTCAAFSLNATGARTSTNTKCWD